MCHKTKPNSCIFTDCCKGIDKMACTAMLNKKNCQKSSSKRNQHAIDHLIILERNNENFIISSDLLSVLLSLKDKKLELVIIKLMGQFDSMSDSKDSNVLNPEPQSSWL